MSYMIDWSSTSSTVHTTSSYQLFDMLYYNKYVYALCGNGEVYKTQDGLTWTLYNSSPDMLTFHSFTHDGQRFVTISYYGKIYTSNNDSNWSLFSEPSNIAVTNPVLWNAIGYGNGVYIIGDNQGNISTSTDLINWTTPTNVKSGPFYDIKYINNKFYLLISGSLYTSDDNGVTWNLISKINGTKLLYLQDYFVVTSLSSGWKPRISSDGTTWTMLSNSDQPSSASCSVYDPYINKIIIATHASIEGIPTAYSYTGKFQPTYLHAWKDNDVISYYAWYSAGTYYYTTTSTPDTSSALYSKSKNRFIVASQTIESVSSDYSYIVIATAMFNRNTGYDFTDGTPRVYTSSLSLTSQQIIYDNSGVDLNREILNVYSNDFDIEITWDALAMRLPQVSENNDYWRCVSYSNDNNFVAITSKGNISTSTDGLTWTPYVASSELGIQSWFRLVHGKDEISGNGKYVALGMSGHVSTSTDGLTWTAAIQPLSTTGSWSNLTFDGTRFIALSTLGDIATSTDGLTWSSSQMLDSNRTWHGLVYGNRKYIALDMYGYISASVDGTTWTTPVQNLQLSIANNWCDIAYNNNMFVALSASGYISRSFDGENWTAATLSTVLGDDSWVDIEAFGDDFIVINSNGYTSITTNL